MALASLTILWRPVRYVSVIWLDLRYNRTNRLYVGSSGRYKVSVSVFELIAPELGNVSQSDFISGSCCLVVSFYSLGGGGGGWNCTYKHLTREGCVLPMRAWTRCLLTMINNLMTTTPSPLLSMSTTSLSPSSSSSLPSLPSLPSSTRRLQETRQQTKFHDLKIICRFHGGWSTSDDRFFQLPEPRADSTNRSSTCKLIYKPLSALRLMKFAELRLFTSWQCLSTFVIKW